jgi:hypothetical protein
MPVLKEPDISDALDFITSLDFDDPQLFHCKLGYFLVTY